MRKRFSIPAALLLLLLVSVSSGSAQNPFEKLTEGQKISGFTVANLYDNASDKVMGARFISDRYGFVLDLLQIQSIPQGFFWVKTIPDSDKGEAHTCEHLLLGKGNMGRYVAGMEDMALGSSSAYTSQLRTCYHFNTIAGEDTFYKIFEAKLKALIHPDFTDEEIRREVCHIGVNVGADGKLSLDEKGTVYTEMVSSFEKPWYYYSRTMDEMLFGPGHPVVNNSGGVPDAIRTQVPADLRKFHDKFYHLGNMGVIVSIPDDVPLDRFLNKMSEILAVCQSQPDKNIHPVIAAENLPAPKPSAPIGTVKIVNYPGDPAQDKAQVVMCWPAALEYDNRENIVLELFLQTLGGGSTSNLYNYFINSQTRKFNLEGGSVGAYSSNDPGHPISVYLSDIDNSYINDKMLDSLRGLVIDEIGRIYNFADNSDSLQAFNGRVRSRLMQNRRYMQDYLNSPPMFGYRSGPGGRWVGLLEFLEKEPGFHRSLLEKGDFDFADSLLNGSNNFWKRYIDHWKLLAVKPYMVGALPSPDILKKVGEEKAARIDGYINNFEKQYGVTDAQAAIAKYKEDFDKKTAELDKIAATGNLPTFIDNPPMTLDDQLKYETITLPRNIPLVASAFENMTSGTVGIDLRMDVVPESLMVYVPILPSLMTDIGVVKDGQRIPYDQMQNLIRREIMRLYAGYDVSYQNGRVELSLVGAGGNREELLKALGWMQAALYTPDISVENIPRMIDLIDQTLVDLRNGMKAPEEYWVEYPIAAYRLQTNPLIMAADCFLTKEHSFHRLKWLLTDPGNEADQKDISALMDSLNSVGKGKSRSELEALAGALETPDKDSANLIPAAIKSRQAASSEKVRSNMVMAAKSIKAVLPEIPDANLSDDWSYLCREIKTDLLTKPGTAIAQMNYVLNLLRKSDNARMYMISNRADRNSAMEGIKKLVAGLDSQNKSSRQFYAVKNRIDDRLRSREPNVVKPVYVGLMNDNTRNGVISLSAQLANPYDTTDQAIIKGLAADLYSGGGAHSFFIKTWGAGLAYSNGVRFNDRSGRFRYYAERCPDISETMRFVVNLAKQPLTDPRLDDYTIALDFMASRAGSTYESRGEAMASDLTDGFTPEVVRRYRQKMMELKKKGGLYDKIKAELPGVYGTVLIGMGTPLKDAPNGSNFIIGPEAQFELLEKYIKGTEGEQKVYRLYPRDFWLTM